MTNEPQGALAFYLKLEGFIQYIEEHPAASQGDVLSGAAEAALEGLRDLADRVWPCLTEHEHQWLNDRGMAP